MRKQDSKKKGEGTPIDDLFHPRGTSFWAPIYPELKGITSQITELMARDSFDKMQASLKLIKSSEVTEEVLKAKYHMAQIYRYGFGQPIDYKESIRLYHEAAQGGLAEAAYDLASLYFEGDKTMGIPQDLSCVRAVIEVCLKNAANHDFEQEYYITQLHTMIKVLETKARARRRGISFLDALSDTKEEIDQTTQESTVEQEISSLEQEEGRVMKSRRLE